MTRSKEFPITPVWMTVQVDVIAKITKLDQNAVRYSVFTGYGLFSCFSKNDKKKNRDHGKRSVSGGVRFYQGTV